MGLSKSQRIAVLLAIDGVFFVIELVVGYTVHSLALVADSFHMLNDVLSLCVGLWAVKVANQESSNTYTYGWQRAETLGALVNGVFLVALCLSIFLEAIQRFFEPQVVSNPKLVLIVGCLGLASNIVGLALFHDHSHGHGHSHGGGDEHSHSHDEASAAEEGHGHSHAHDHSDGHTHSESHDHAHSDHETRLVGDENGTIEDVLPQVRVAGYKGQPRNSEFSKSDEENTTLSNRSSNTPLRKTTVTGNESPTGSRGHRRRMSASFGRGFGSVDNIHVHPASFRQEIIAAGRLEEQPESDIDEEALENSMDERSRLFDGANGSHANGSKQSDYGSMAKRKSTDYQHDEHHHNKKSGEPASGGHGHGGHSHSDLNMRGVFLHVAGDALGNIGVIASALIIWLATFEGRYYFDPAISLVITIIILYSAIPLCKAASRILLQAVPVGLSIDEIKNDIQSLPRVIEAHHIHVWQLSDSKLVASLHVKVDCEIEGTGSASYMHLAREIRSCLHGYGIHSSTIQPEFTTASEEAEAEAEITAAEGSGASGPGSPKHEPTSKAGSLRDGRSGACLLDCGDNCGGGKQCCPPSDGKSGHR